MESERSHSDGSGLSRPSLTVPGILLAVVLGLSPGMASEPATISGSGKAPVPAAVSRESLLEVFRKPGPTSVADLKDVEKHIKPLVARVSPAIVAVEIGGGTGTGVVVSPDGLVLTVAHLSREVHRSARLIFPDGKTVRGRVIGLDEENDAGVIRITGRGPWPYAPVGELGSLEVGDWVLALGHPGGYDAGRSLVVRLGRLIRLTGNNLQSDCTITLGDSGGPLLDMHGRVIGIHTSIRGSMAQNYHVPITDFLDGWEQLVKADIPAED